MLCWLTAALLTLSWKINPFAVKRKWTHCNALHCTACHNEQRLSGARGERTRGDVEGRTGAKCYAKAGGDLVGKVHTISVHELAPDGNWQVGKAEENCIDKLCLGRPWARPLATLQSHQGKLRQSEISLQLSVDGSSLRPSCTAAKHRGRILIKMLMRKAQRFLK